MKSLIPGEFYLTEIHYLPEKRQAVVGFEGEGRRRYERFPFLPSLVIKADAERVKLIEEMLSFYGRKRCRLNSIGEGRHIIESETFSDLKKI